MSELLDDRLESLTIQIQRDPELKQLFEGAVASLQALKAQANPVRPANALRPVERLAQGLTDDRKLLLTFVAAWQDAGRSIEGTLQTVQWQAAEERQPFEKYVP